MVPHAPPPSRPRKRTALTLLLVSVLSGCAALIGALPFVFDAAQKLFGTVKHNFGNKEAQVVERLLTALANPNLAESLKEKAKSLGFAPSADARGVLAVEEGAQFGLLEVAFVVQQPGGQPKQVSDGAVVEDRGDPKQSDRWWLQLRPTEKCYLYVVNVDSTGWLEPLFPAPKFSEDSNPFTADDELILPGTIGGKRFSGRFDSNKGIEHFYILASSIPRPDIEELLKELEGRQRPPPQTGEYESVSAAAVATRGVLSVGEETTVTDENGAEFEVIPQQVLVSKGDADLLITRWFNHK